MCDACSMSDPFELVARSDNPGLEAALAVEPARAGARNAAGASLVAWAAYVGNRQAVAIIRPLLDGLDPHEAIILGEAAGLEDAIAAGWDPETLSPDGFGPLALAAFFGNEAAWSFAFYTYSHERYEPSVFANGTVLGTPEEAFDLAAVYL